MSKMDAPMGESRKNPNENEFDLFGRIVSTAGAVSYELFSTKILIQKQFSSVFGRRDAVMADILWINAHIGFGFFLYRQNIFRHVRTPWRITYSVFGATLFNFGSVLFWGTTRALLPNMSVSTRLVFGLGSGITLMFIGWKLFQDIDRICFKVDQKPVKAASTFVDNS